MDEATEAKLHTATALLDDELRRIGLYLETTQVIEAPHGESVLYCEVLVGDVAFTTRVQDPEQSDVDKEFKRIERSAVQDTFLSTREDLARRIAEGRPLFGDRS